MNEEGVQVVDNVAVSRYEARVEGSLAGIADYKLRPGQIVLPHVEVGRDYEGHGVGSALAEAALTEARRRNLAVVPQCPFVKKYIETHPEHADLVAQETRG